MRLRIKVIGLLGLILCAGSLWFLVAHVQRALRIAHTDAAMQPLPEPLIELDSARGQLLLKHSLLKADYDVLRTYYEPQVYRSYCGVASGVMSINALRQRKQVNQSSFFEARPDGLRSSYRTFFGGMTLKDFSDLLRSYDFETHYFHGGTLSLPAFRERVKQNLMHASDTLVVNYDRKVVGQKGGGHFSPLAAYHGPSDHVLILDVARHRYPSAWVPLADVWRAMDTEDSDSGRTRGFVEIVSRVKLTPQ